MARNKSGGFNRLLNFIGLVDDEDPRDTYGEEYQNGNYGRQAAYTPARPQRGGRASSQRRSLPEPRSGRDDRTSRQGRSAYTGSRVASSYERRPSSRFDDTTYNDYMPRSEQDERYSGSTSRYDGAGSGRYDSGSRFSDSPRPRGESGSRLGIGSRGENLPQRAPANRMRVSQRSRTVMYSLHSLEDCCEVIDQLIANNTVVLTMDELDGRLLQRAVDTLSGAVFALHASIRKASDRTYLVAPMSVEVNDAFDVERGFR